MSTIIFEFRREGRDLDKKDAKILISDIADLARETIDDLEGLKITHASVVVSVEARPTTYSDHEISGY